MKPVAPYTVTAYVRGKEAALVIVRTEMRRGGDGKKRRSERGGELSGLARGVYWLF